MQKKGVIGSVKRQIKRGLAVLLGLCLIVGNGAVTGSTSFAADTKEDTQAGAETSVEGADAAETTQPETGSLTGTESGQAGEQTESETPSGKTEENETLAEDTEKKKENSWRYRDGELIESYEIYGRSSYSQAWELVNGVYMNSAGEPIEGAVKKGIDVSEHQGKIDWDKVKEAGIGFVILRCGYGDDLSNQDDQYWAYNVSECERLGIPYGVYLYSYATDMLSAESEAQHVLRLIQGHNLSYPVYLDMEDSTMVNVSAEMKGEIAKTFCDIISASGYSVGIYANLDWWTTKLTSSVFDNASWSKWIAQYNTTCDYEGDYDIWQCTSSGTVSGISGNVDLNFQMDAMQGDGSGQTPPGSTEDDDPGKNPDVFYQSYVHGAGWQETKTNGATSGTSGQSLAIEALKVQVSSPSYSGGVTYSTYMQTYGWRSAVSNNAVSGIAGGNKRVEAVKMNLTGELSEHFDIYYRAYVQTYGWLGWAKNGETAGTSDYSKRLESIQIKIVAKGEEVLGDTSGAYLHPLIQYKTHVQTYGWQSLVKDGATSGTSGISKRLEAIQISLPDQDYSGNVEYKTHVQTYGWQGWVKNGATSGTSGQSKRLEAIQIKLTGEMAKHYDIYYRVHSQTYGWLGWAKNGESAGTEGLSKRLEAIQIQLVPKGGSAPGSTTGAFIKK